MNPVIGTLKGFDQLMNLVLDDVRELTRGIYISQPPSRILKSLTLSSIQGREKRKQRIPPSQLA
jgi:small nuclear ribonucleoprotein (snRNP)-like protein